MILKNLMKIILYLKKNYKDTINMYYNYHAKIKKLINENKLIKYEYGDYKKIKNALILTFEDGKTYPIRDYKIEEYLTIIDSKNNK